MTQINSYDTSVIAFNKIFVDNNHINKQVLYPEHNPNKSTSVDLKDVGWRLAVDIQFLSVLENQARAKGEIDFASQVLSQLDLAIKNLKTQLSSESFHVKLFSPYVAQNLNALSFVKKFNMSELSSKGYTTSYNAVNTLLPVFLNSAVNSYTQSNATWSADIFGAVTSKTYQSITKEQKHVVADNGLKRFAGSLNVYSIIGGALGIYGALVVGGTPASYIHRSKIVELGDLNIAMSLSGSPAIGHLNNIGGGNERGDKISTGYASWVARGLSQMAIGTTFDLYNPTSKYLTEANLIKAGLLTVLDRVGYMPESFTSFNGSEATSNGSNMSSDKTAYLYELTWCNDQTAINTIERHLATKHGLGSVNPIIIDTLLSDDATRNIESNMHRVLAGLTGGMIKGIMFNYSTDV